MQIDTQAWQALANKLRTTATTPPTPVYTAMYTLTRGAPIVASYAQCQLGDSSTSWLNWVITEDSILIHTELEFAAADYDSYAEDRLLQVDPHGGVVPDIHQGWARRLDTITSLHIDTAGRLIGFRLGQYLIGDLRLAFADGTSMTLPSQVQLQVDDRPRFDQFITVLRDRVRL